MNQPFKIELGLTVFDKTPDFSKIQRGVIQNENGKFVVHWLENEEEDKVEVTNLEDCIDNLFPYPSTFFPSIEHSNFERLINRFDIYWPNAIKLLFKEGKLTIDEFKDRIFGYSNLDDGVLNALMKFKIYINEVSIIKNKKGLHITLSQEAKDYESEIRFLSSIIDEIKALSDRCNSPLMIKTRLQK